MHFASWDAPRYRTHQHHRYARASIREEHPLAATTADLLINRLFDWGVDTIFGLPGDGINALFDSLRPRRDRLRFIQVRHEEAAC